jgi:hypothetical protein
MTRLTINRMITRTNAETLPVPPTVFSPSSLELCLTWGLDQGGSFGTGANAERPRYGLGSEERKDSSISALLSASLVAQVSLDFTVPANFVGLIIGRGGESLRNIERTTGAKIQFSQGRSCILYSKLDADTPMKTLELMIKKERLRS